MLLRLPLLSLRAMLQGALAGSSLAQLRALAEASKQEKKTFPFFMINRYPLIEK